MKIINDIKVVDDLNPVLQAKLDLLNKKICYSKFSAGGLEPIKFWVGTFVDGEHVPQAGLYPKQSSVTALFNTAEEACAAAFEPNKHGMKWGAK